MKKLSIILLLGVLLSSCDNIPNKQHTLKILSVTAIEPNKIVNMVALSYIDNNIYSFYVNKGWGGNVLLLAMDENDVDREIVCTRTHNIIDGYGWEGMGFVTPRGEEIK